MTTDTATTEYSHWFCPKCPAEFRTAAEVPAHIDAAHRTPADLETWAEREARLAL